MSIARNCLWGALAAAGLAAGAAEASATAISEVRRNIFDVHPTWGVVDGVNVGAPGNPIGGIFISVVSQTTSLTKTETGNASVTFDTPAPFAGVEGFGGASIKGSAIANPDGYAHGVLTFTVTLAFTNLSGLDLDFLTIHTGFSAFNPGGPAVGASVDDGALEFARFFTGQSGPAIGDSHKCDTRLPNSGGNQLFLATPPGVKCGVGSPDFSEAEFYLSDLDQGETQTRTFTLTLDLEVSSVAEPSTLALFAAALAAIIFVRVRPKHALAV